MFSSGLLNGLFVVPILGILIVIHEIGHFVAARSVGVTVEEFGIGIPPRVKGWTRNGVLWSINWLPIGGFVRVKGEDANDTDPGSMNTKGPGQRAFFLVAGSAMNFLLAFVLIVTVLVALGELQPRVYVGTVRSDSPALVAGLQAGDRILEVAGSPVDATQDVQETTEQFLGREMAMVVSRDGQLIDVVVMPRANPAPGEGAIGIGLQAGAEGISEISAVDTASPAETAGFQAGDRILAVNGRAVTDVPTLAFALRTATGATVPITVDRDGVTSDLALAIPVIDPAQTDPSIAGLRIQSSTIFQPVAVGEILPRAMDQAWTQATAIVIQVGDLVTGKVPLSEVRGPVGIGEIVGQIVQVSPFPLWVTIADIMILLSLNLGLLNLLPLPALDGGRLLFVIIEVLRGGRRVSPEREGLVHLTGFVLLIGLMLVIFYADLNRIVGG